MHGEAFGELDARMLLGIQEVPDDGFFRMIRTRRITGGRADAAIFLRDQIIGGEILRAAKTPFITHALVQVFGKRLRQAVGDGFRHDGVVVVVLCLELLDNVLQADAGGDCKRTDIILGLRLADGELGRNEIRETPVRRAVAFLDLLPQKMERRP